jgi:hypothetical protein
MVATTAAAGPSTSWCPVSRVGTSLVTSRGTRGASGVTYVIYEQKIWQAGNPTSEWKVMPDRGSATANHYDHVHVSVS